MGGQVAPLLSINEGVKKRPLLITRKMSYIGETNYA